MCGGLGEHFGVDPTLVRIAFVLFALMGGPGIVAYLVFTLVMPEPRALPAPARWQLPGR